MQLPRGECLPGGVCPEGCLPQCKLGYTPFVNRMTDACENLSANTVADGKNAETNNIICRTTL